MHDRRHCIELARELASLVYRELSREPCDCILLSGGIDTSFITVSYTSIGGRFRLAVIEAPWLSEDLPYALRLASMLNLRIAHSRLEGRSLRDSIDLAVSLLAIADPVEVASAAAAALALGCARAEGCRCVVTGDGGDELFLGYDFLLSMERRELDSWRRRMAAGAAYFTVDDVADALGVKVVHPLYSPSVRGFSQEIPLECLVNKGPDGRVYGKFLMRLYLHLAGLPWLAWRAKTPVTHGSGVLEALESLSRGSTPLEGWEPSRPHAYLVRRLKEMGILKPKCSEKSRACPVCGRCIERGRCRFCGAVTSRGGVSVYRGLAGLES